MVSARDGAEISNDSAATHSARFRTFMAVSLLVRRLRRFSSCWLRRLFGRRPAPRKPPGRPAATRSRCQGLVVGAPVALKHEADVRIRIGADVLAGDVEHVVPRVCAVLLLRQRARGGADDQSEGNGSLGEHGRLLLRNSLTPCWCAPAFTALRCV